MKTLLKKSHELGQSPDINVAVIPDYKGRYFSYRSVDRESWPPSMKQIVSHTFMRPLQVLNVKQQISYPLPKNMLPQDMENPLQKSTEQKF